MEARIKKSKFLPPYKPNGRTTFGAAQSKTGVYLIKENDVVVYVGYSGSDIYRTLYRHFQYWNHRTQETISYAGKRKDYTVRIVFCSKADAIRLERGLILKHNPRDNKNKYDSYLQTGRDKTVLKAYEDSPVEKWYHDKQEADF
jgi:predicted GIY-YIG superfamily endonuclease